MTTKDYPTLRNSATTYRHSVQAPLSERLCAKAFVAAYLGKPWERYIPFARAAARREEFEEAFERAQDQLRKGARV